MNKEQQEEIIELLELTRQKALATASEAADLIARIQEQSAPTVTEVADAAAGRDPDEVVELSGKAHRYWTTRGNRTAS